MTVEELKRKIKDVKIHKVNPPDDCFFRRHEYYALYRAKGNPAYFFCACIQDRLIPEGFEKLFGINNIRIIDQFKSEHISDEHQVFDTIFEVDGSLFKMNHTYNSWTDQVSTAINMSLDSLVAVEKVTEEVWKDVTE